MRLTLRPIDLASDGPTIVRYAKDLFTISFGSTARFVEQFGEDSSGYAPWIAQKQAIAPSYASLACKEGQPAGMVLLGPWPDDPAVGYVYHLYLEPRVRGRGLAAELDLFAVAALRAQGHDTARLSVAQSNRPALHFYRKQGWTEAGPRPDQPGILYMWRKLAGEEA
jgi:ribosomal protein S18 acetylase RimI-like enzyme